MDIHVFTSSVLGVVPRSPEQLWDKLQHAAQVLAQEPRMLVSGVALVLAGLALGLARRRSSALAWAFAVAVTGVLWLRVSQQHEGAILVGFSREHGLTEADLLVPLVVLAAGLVRLARTRLSPRTPALSGR